MEKVTEIKVFIASPSDVSIWRSKIEDILTKIKIDNIRIAVYRWEKDMPVTSAATPQQIINETLLSHSDILVGIFWKKFGSPTKDHDSGTVEEIELHLKDKKPAILYFVDKSVEMNKIEPDDISKINNFKTKYRNQNIYRNVKTYTELNKFLELDIKFNVEKIMKNMNKNNIKISNFDFFKEKPLSLIKSFAPINWFDYSITAAINQYFISSSVEGVTFSRDITFEENCELNKTGTNLVSFESIAKRAREFAFDTKYGNYDYSYDLRSKYPDWSNDVSYILKKLVKNLNNKKVIGVGSNYGIELLQVFNDYNNVQLDVLEISREAIKRGKRENPSINFHYGNMEEPLPVNKKYDIYVNLRAIHSSGVKRHQTILEASRSVKPGGVVLFSVSNGYLIEENDNILEKKGIYDQRSKTFTESRPYDLATKIRNKMSDYGFVNTGIHSIDTEILVYGVKPKQPQNDIVCS